MCVFYGILSQLPLFKFIVFVRKNFMLSSYEVTIDNNSEPVCSRFRLDYCVGENRFGKTHKEQNVLEFR